MFQSNVCLFCMSKQTRPFVQKQHQQWRQYAALKSRLPSRMSLSPKVSRPNRDVTPSGKPVRKSRNSPFGGMNQRVADIRGVPERSSPVFGRRSKDKGPVVKKEFDYKALKMQKSLATMSPGRRTSIKDSIAELDSFDSFKFLPTVSDAISSQALQGMTNIRPTPVQRIAIPALLGEVPKYARKREAKNRTDFLIAAETGSGKTLAYLLPTIDAIKRAETADEEFATFEKAKQEEEARQKNLVLVTPPPLTNMPHPTTGRPRAIILVPTSELVTQVGKLVKSLSHTIKFRSCLLSSSFSGPVIRNRLFSSSGIDLVVSTPHLLSSIAESDPNILSRVTHLIIDEADSLLDRGFSPLTSSIIDKATPSLKQLILCSATIPRSLDSFLRKRFPDIRRLTTPNLHAVPRRVILSVVDVEKFPYKSNKNLACADTIWNIGKAGAEHEGPDKSVMDVKRIMVFVNERESTETVAEFLKSKGIDAVALNRDTPNERQAAILADFTTAEAMTTSRPVEDAGSLADNQPNYVPPGQEAPATRRKLPNTKVLVVTDLGSRGIDTLAVRNVILFDVPHSTVDFIHRLGRTGRMGRRGRGWVLVGKDDRRDVVAEVREMMFNGAALI